MKKFLFFLSIPILFFSCSQSQPSGSESSQPKELPTYSAFKGETQGTFFDIQYKEEKDFTAEIKLILKQIDDGFNLWDSTSTISKLNDWKEINKAFSFNDTTLYFPIMMDVSREIYEKTDHAFDPSVLPLLKLWNFGKDISEEPSQKEIDQVLEIIGYSEFDFMLYDNPYEDARTEPVTIRKTHADKKLDFNAIVQGYTCDLIGDMFIENGVEDFMVNVGGEIKVSGKNPSGEPWTLGIQDPRKDDGKYKSVIQLTDCGVATSGSYNKFKIIDGVRHSHTIDGRLGRPVTHSLLSCTVIAQTAYQADAYATAFMVMGKEVTHQFLIENPDLGLKVYLIEDSEGELKVTHTPDFPIVN